MTAIYLAGPYAARERLRGFADDLTEMAIEVTASWLEDSHAITPGTVDAATDLSDSQVSKRANDDLDDIANADLLILITAKVAGVAGSSGGRHVETGYAIAAGIPVLVVGAPENVFHRIGAEYDVSVVPNWRSAVTLLATVETGDYPLRQALS